MIEPRVLDFEFELASEHVPSINQEVNIFPILLDDKPYQFFNYEDYLINDMEGH